MKKMIKRIIAICFSCMILTSMTITAKAADAQTEVSSAKKYSFSVNQAVDYALKNNRNLLSLKFQDTELKYTVEGLKSSRRSLVKTIEAMQDAHLSVSGMTSSFDAYLLKNKVTEVQIQKQRELAQKGTDVQNELLKLTTENAYYNVLIAKVKYEDAVRNYNVVANEKTVGEIKLNSGVISDMQFKSMEIQLNAAEMNVVNAKYNYDEAKMDFNDALGIELDAEVTFTSPINTEIKEITENENKKEELRKNDLTFLAAKLTYEVSEENLPWAKAFYGYSSDDFKKEEAKAEKAKLTYQNEKNSLERRIKSTYNNLDVLKKAVKISKDKSELMRLSLGIATVRKNYGTAVEDDVIKASMDYNSALNDYYQNVMNYNMLVSMFEKNIMG